MQSKDTALVIVDVQGKLARLMQNSDACIKQIGIMIQASQLLGIPILWAEQVPDKLGATVPEIADLLADAQPIQKAAFSCAGSEEFNQALRATGCNQVLLVGIEAHVCVYQTALGLLREGKAVALVTDAIASRTAENRDVGLKSMCAAGATLTSVEMCLFEMMETAEHSKFRDISRLLK